MGLASTLIMAGLYSQPFFGWLLELHWDQKIVDGARIYSAANYNLALSIMPIAFVFGLIAALFIKETYCKSVEDRTAVSQPKKPASESIDELAPDTSCHTYPIRKSAD